jgi:hypothetical protein
MIERLAIPDHIDAEVRDAPPQNAPDWTDAPEEWSEPEAPAQTEEQKTAEAKQPEPEVEMTDPLESRAVGYAAHAWNAPASKVRKDIEKAITDGKLKNPMPKDDFKKWVTNPQGEPQPT